MYRIEFRIVTRLSTWYQNGIYFLYHCYFLHFHRFLKPFVNVFTIYRPLGHQLSVS